MIGITLPSHKKSVALVLEVDEENWGGTGSSEFSWEMGHENGAQ